MPKYFPFCMGTETGTPHTETVAEGQTKFINAVAVVVGSLVALFGSFVLFAAPPVVSANPVFGVSSIEPVSVVVNMAIGTLITTTGAVVAIPNFDRLLKPF